MSIAKALALIKGTVIYDSDNDCLHILHTPFCCSQAKSGKEWHGAWQLSHNGVFFKEVL